MLDRDRGRARARRLHDRGPHRSRAREPRLGRSPRRSGARRTATASPSAYYHFAVAQLEAQQGQIQDAIKELREAIKQDPGTGFLWVQLSQWLARTGDVPAALEAAQKAITLDPTSQVARLTLADLLRRQKRPADAERELEQAITLNPAVAGSVSRSRPALPRAEGV